MQPRGSEASTQSGLFITATPPGPASALPPELGGEEAIELVRVRPRAHAGALAVPRAAGHVPNQ